MGLILWKKNIFFFVTALYQKAKLYLKSIHKSTDYTVQPHSADHDENVEVVSRLLLVHPAQQVVADDVHQTRPQVVFSLHHHIDAVRAQGGEPAREGLQ